MDQKESKNQKIFIEILKFLAVVLVFNSHLDKLYPIKALATGGAIGNSIFFFVSGYTWMNGANKAKFIPWYGKKLKRVYVPTIFTNIVYVVLFFSANMNFFQIFVYPNKSWFCGALLLYAIFYYFIAKCSDKQIALFLFGGFIVYIVWYFTKVDLSVFSVESMARGGLCRTLYYAGCMLVGLLFRKKNIQGNPLNRRKWVVITIFAVSVFYLEKYLMSHFVIMMKLQCINQFTTLFIVMALFITLQLYEEFYDTKKWNIKFINTVSKYSWELYLVQTLVIPFCVGIIFPLNCVVALAITVFGAWLLKKIVSLIVK